MDRPIKIEDGVFLVPIILPESLKHREGEFRETLLNAQRRLKKFAKDYGWEHHTQESFLDRFEIHDDKAEFNRRILEITGQTVEDVLKSASMEGTEIPDCFSAGLENRILIAVSPELFVKNIPEVGEEFDFYEKLAAHEIAHRLHIRILNGNEEAMGPVWFFEGFAIFAVDQFLHKLTDLSSEEIWDIVRTENRGSYFKYNVVFRHFLKKTTLQEMVEKAGHNDFISWLEQLEKKPVPERFNYVF